MRCPRPIILAAVLALVAWLGPRSLHAETTAQRGYASYYAQYHEGLRTASGERFHPEALTAAHRSLPFGTRVRVTNLANGRHVIVRINDRGPYVRGRMLDVSYAAARQLGMLQSGVGRIRMQVLRG
jgi:rare lipoprotein A